VDQPEIADTAIAVALLEYGEYGLYPKQILDKLLLRLLCARVSG